MFANFCRRTRRLMYIFYEDFINKKEIYNFVYMRTENKIRSCIQLILYFCQVIYTQSDNQTKLYNLCLFICFIFEVWLYGRYTIIYSCYTKWINLHKGKIKIVAYNINHIVLEVAQFITKRNSFGILYKNNKIIKQRQKVTCMYTSISNYY